MKIKTVRNAKIILVVYLITLCAFLIYGYSVQKPEIRRQEFPFTITYSCQGKTETISDIYVGEHIPVAKYIGDNSVVWYGYVKDRNRLEADFYRIGELEGKSFSINLNLNPGYLMGDPNHAGTDCAPTIVCHCWDGTNETVIEDPEELAQLGFSLVSWEYPEPIENSFSFGGISLSSEATMYTAAISILALLACMFLTRRDRDLVYGKVEKLSIVVNFLLAFVVFPFVLLLAMLSEIVAEVTFGQQMMYLSPALTVLLVAVSTVMRRCGSGKNSLLVQLLGFALIVVVILTGGY